MELSLFASILSEIIEAPAAILLLADTMRIACLTRFVGRGMLQQDSPTGVGAVAATDKPIRPL